MTLLFHCYRSRFLPGFRGCFRLIACWRFVPCLAWCLFTAFLFCLLSFMGRNTIRQLAFVLETTVAILYVLYTRVSFGFGALINRLSLYHVPL